MLLPLAVGVVRYKKLSEAARRIIWLLLAWLIAETVAQVLARKGIANWNVYVALSFVEIVIITEFYRRVFVSRKAKSLVAWIAWGGLVLVCTEYAISNSPDNMVTMFFECTFFFGMGLFAFYEMVIYKSWQYDLLVSCIMLFFLTSAVYFSTWKFMKYDKSLFILFGNVHAFVMIAGYGFFTYSLWRSR